MSVFLFKDKDAIKESVWPLPTLSPTDPVPRGLLTLWARAVTRVQERLPESRSEHYPSSSR